MSHVNRFEFVLQEKDISPEEAEVMQPRRIWRTLSVLKNPILLNPHLNQFLQELAPHVHKDEFPMVTLELIPELYDSVIQTQEKIDSKMSGAIDDFAKQYAAESGVSLSYPSSALLNKNRGVSKGKCNGYGLDIPVGTSNKPFIYAFIDVVIKMASVAKSRFRLTNKKTALFVLYTLQHLPFFNLQTDFRNIKTSRLWPVLSHKDGQTSVIAAARPLVHSSTASLDLRGPFDYQGGHLKVFQRTSPLLIILKVFRKMRVKVSISQTSAANLSFNPFSMITTTMAQPSLTLVDCLRLFNEIDRHNVKPLIDELRQTVGDNHLLAIQTSFLMY